jgi:hypothetical protein
MEEDSELTSDLIYLIGELYVQRRLEQMKNDKLRKRILELESEKGRADDEHN